MVFTSFNFLIFFPSIALIYFVVPRRFRWIVLLVSSYFFYINIKPIFALLLVGITCSTYFFTLAIDHTKNESRKKLLMQINSGLILAPLFFYKYFNAINESVFTLLENLQIRWPLPEIQLILPLGISYYTFMAIGYTIDVYNEDIKAEKNIGIVGLFLGFFPLILSGPIERATNMIPQFKAQINFNYESMVQGLKLMLWGYFMKLVVADRIGVYLDPIFDNVADHNGTTLLIASILYPFQVYADLGGYSLIAIGTAKILGINVMPNFNRPFFAISMSEFWRRWHMSLILWLTDYVFTPLAFHFRKFKIWGVVLALMITFFLSGIWHEATILFIIWGLMQGIFLSIEALAHKRRGIVEAKYGLRKRKWYIISGICLTFILFSSSEVFTRVNSLDDAIIVFQKILTNPGSLYTEGRNFMYGIMTLFLLISKDFLDEFYPTKFLLFENKHKFIRFLAYSSIALIIILFGAFENPEFIYFQF